MEKYQRGFTITELLFVVWFFVVLAVIGGVGYVAYHFISKFW